MILHFCRRASARTSARWLPMSLPRSPLGPSDQLCTNEVNFSAVYVSVGDWHVLHFFPEREPWAHKQSTRFALFALSKSSSSPVVLLPLASVSRFVLLFDAFCALLFGSFLLYVQKCSAARADRSRSAARCHTCGSPERHALQPPRCRTLDKYFVWGPPPIFFVQRRVLYWCFTKTYRSSDSHTLLVCTLGSAAYDWERGS